MIKNIRRLPDAELEVMQAIWACEPPVARNSIETILQETHEPPMALTTLLTLLSRVQKKSAGATSTHRWFPRPTTWHPRAAGSWISSAAAVFPLSLTPSATAV